MPKFKPSILISDCWGSVGDLTFYHVGGQCFYKKKATGAFPGTAGQLDQLEVHRRALAAWRTLEQEVQDVWNGLAEPVVSHRPPFDGNGRISGQNLFVSAYHGFYTLGDEHVPTPQAWEAFPVYSIEFQDAAVYGGDLRLSFRTFFPEEVPANRYHILMKVQLTEAGRGKKPGLMRNFLAEEACSNDEGCALVTVDNFAERWGLNLDRYQVHCRCILLDRKTGYRTTYRELSFLTGICQ